MVASCTADSIDDCDLCSCESLSPRFDVPYSIEQDERFHAWIEEWIAGHIEMQEVAKRYRAFLNERSAMHRARSAAAENIEPLDLETEIE